MRVVLLRLLLLHRNCVSTLLKNTFTRVIVVVSAHIVTREDNFNSLMYNDTSVNLSFLVELAQLYVVGSTIMSDITGMKEGFRSTVGPVSNSTVGA